MADAFSATVDVEVWVNDKEGCQGSVSLFFEVLNTFSLLDLKKFTRKPTCSLRRVPQQNIYGCMNVSYEIAFGETEKHGALTEKA